LPDAAKYFLGAACVLCAVAKLSYRINGAPSEDSAVSSRRRDSYFQGDEPMIVQASAARKTSAVAKPASNEASGTETGTVHRAVRLLTALAEANGEVRVGELAGKLGLAPSTTHRLLHLLKKEGLVQWLAHTHSYSIGPELLRISSRVVASVGITEVAQDFLHRLVQRFSETVVLGLYLPTHPAVTFAVRADGLHALQYQLPMHQPLSLLRGASGKSVLAFLPEEVASRAFAVEHMMPGGAADLPSRVAMAQSLKRIRRDGFAMTEGERLPGAQGVAAPIFGSAGVIGCLCITAPKGRVPRHLVQSMANELVAEAHSLSRIFGATTENSAVDND
jgi:DNA-binding IclR family transcriptional regulator